VIINNHRQDRPVFKWSIILIIVPLTSFLVLNALFPIPKGKLHPSASLRILDHEGKILRVYLSDHDSYHFPVTLAEVSPYLTSATLAYEDKWFYYHPGINPVAIARAAWLNLRAGEILSGGSTITQQVARMMQTRERTMSSKIIEAFRAMQLELNYSKSEILSFYMNLAPYGGNIVGASAAAYMYFGKPVYQVGPGEAALLAAIPTSPTKLRPDRHPDAARSRRDVVLERMFKYGKIDEQRYRLSLNESIPVSRISPPRYAPHFCDDLAANYSDVGGTIKTTINLDIQRMSDKLLKRHMETIKHRGVTNGAVVIIDNKTTSLLTLIGSADYDNQLNSGQVNGALALRSPGSTLKPFIYGLAIDQGKISPSTLLEDLPVNYSGYSPVNYNEEFNGIVTVEQALTHSMNVPAVNLTRQMGLSNLIDFLRGGGISSLKNDADYYGLSLILGGVGIKLFDLTTIYAGLANNGVFRVCRILDEQKILPGDNLISKEAVYILSEMLSQVKRPDFPSTWEATINLPKIAWKTGTSYGHRDAWSIGYTPRYTVGVWIGNFSGVGNPVLVGADAAAPLLFDLMTALEPDGGIWFRKPVDVKERQVCALSGKIPGKSCEASKRELYIYNKSPAKICDLHVTFTLDEKTGARLCPHCRVGRSHKEMIFTKWQPSVATWLLQNGRETTPPPPHFAECSSILLADAPDIKSPPENCKYVLRRNVPLEDQRILLEAAVSADVQTLYWFVDGELIHEGTPDKQYFYKPEPGKHELLCMDDEGRQSTCIVRVLN